ncbi:unnamed protein product [Symbiodinium sp. KB8]|nr:unnamed protein product [Symbiodinium sp. KB8]
MLDAGVLAADVAPLVAPACHSSCRVVTELALLENVRRISSSPQPRTHVPSASPATSPKSRVLTGGAPEVPAQMPAKEDLVPGRGGPALKALLQQANSCQGARHLSLQEKQALQRHALAASRKASAASLTCRATTSTPVQGGSVAASAASPRSPVRAASPLSRTVNGAHFIAFGREVQTLPTSRSVVVEAGRSVQSPGLQDAASLRNAQSLVTAADDRLVQSTGASLGTNSFKGHVPVAAAESTPHRVSGEQMTGERPVTLREGIVVRIAERRFRISEPLGTGSYGVVWCARNEDAKESKEEFAIKEIFCRSQVELKNALFEGNILARLGGNFPTAAGKLSSTPSLSSRIPSMAAEETESLGSKGWRVRLAMSRLAGEPLALVLRCHKQASLEALPAKDALRLLAEPCRIASELLAQLGPALQELSRVVYHRDVNPRNILVDHVSTPGQTSFGLVDFGMAVDTHKWLGTPKGSSGSFGSSTEEDGAWRHVEVGGDCRYWPLSSWIMFMRGPQDLHPGSPLRAEYQTGLDLHALGVTALQVFMEMSPLLPAELTGSAEHRHLLQTFRSLQNAWYRYWEDVSTFWASLMKCFSSGGNWMVLKSSCIEAGLDNVLSGRLSDLRGTLEEMGSASMRLADSQVCEQMVLLVRTLLTLLSNADEQRRAQQRPSELPKQQARILQPQHVQNRQHLPHEQKPGCKIGPPQQQVIGSSLKQARQQQGWLQNRPQAGSHNESTNQQEPYRSTLPSDRISTVRGLQENSTRTPRSSLPHALANTGSSLTVRCAESSDISTTLVGTLASAPRQRSLSPLFRRPRSGNQSPSQYIGPVWTKTSTPEGVRLASGYNTYSTIMSPALAAEHWSGAHAKIASHGNSWAVQSRSIPCAANSGEGHFRNA